MRGGQQQGKAWSRRETGWGQEGPEHILQDSAYMTCPEQVNLLKSKTYWLVVARVWWEGRIGTLTARG